MPAAGLSASAESTTGEAISASAAAATGIETVRRKRNGGLDQFVAGSRRSR